MSNASNVSYLFAVLNVHTRPTRSRVEQTYMSNGKHTISWHQSCCMGEFEISSRGMSPEFSTKQQQTMCMFHPCVSTQPLPRSGPRHNNNAMPRITVRVDYYMQQLLRPVQYAIPPRAQRCQSLSIFLHHRTCCARACSYSCTGCCLPSVADQNYPCLPTDNPTPRWARCPHSHHS